VATTRCVPLSMTDSSVARLAQVDAREGLAGSDIEGVEVAITRGERAGDQRQLALDGRAGRDCGQRLRERRATKIARASRRAQREAATTTSNVCCFKNES
jgi:hypothetical protein